MTNLLQEPPLTITSPPALRGDFQRTQRRLDVAGDSGRPTALAVHSAGLTLQAFPSIQDGCEDSCHYCCGPETD